MAPKRTTLGFAIILIAALLAVAFAATRTQAPDGLHATPVPAAGSR